MELDDFYGVPNYIIVIFFGGPHDGTERAFPELLNHISVPVSAIPEAYFIKDHYPVEITYKLIIYELMRDPFFYPSRDDNGRYKYKFGGIK